MSIKNKLEHFVTVEESKEVFKMSNFFMLGSIQTACAQCTFGSPLVNQNPIM